MYIPIINQTNVQAISIPASPVPEVGTSLRVVPTFISSSGAICSQPVTWTETIVDLEKKLVQMYGTWEPKVCTNKGSVKLHFYIKNKCACSDK